MPTDGENRRESTTSKATATTAESTATSSTTPDRKALHLEIAELVEGWSRGTSYGSSEHTDALAQVLTDAGDFCNKLHYLCSDDIRLMHRVFAEYISAHPNDSKEVCCLLSSLTVNAYALAEKAEVAQLIADVSCEIEDVARKKYKIFV